MIEIGKHYLFKQKTSRGLYEAIIEVTGKVNDGYTYGDEVVNFCNEPLWHDKGLSLSQKGFIKEVTQESHPEYYL